MAIVFYVLAAISLMACLYGASESKYDIVAYAAAAAIMLFFMGAVLNYLSDILDELRKSGGGGEPKTGQEPKAKDLKQVENK